MDAGDKKLKDKVLGKKYELSLVFTDSKLSKKLNRIYRGKNKPTNVLAFQLSKNSGEIFIDKVTAKIEAKDFNMTYKKFVKYLFIHALLHLKGMAHGAKMNMLELKLLGEVSIIKNGTSNSSRH